EPLFSARAIGSTNLSRFNERRFDRLLDRDARRATTPEDQALVYQELEDMACAEMPVVPVSSARTTDTSVLQFGHGLVVVLGADLLDVG
ncbi:MAG: hypothetical protein KY395_03135, partial [Actinobacteria bacterium]|nr:hypothetical protein [Actinomycetota bacterium]